MRFLWSCLKALLVLFGIIAILPLFSFIPPKHKFTSTKAPERPMLEGKLAPNKYLDNVEHMFEGEVMGPECFTVLNGELYTSLHGGFVAKIVGNEIVPVVKFGKPCENWMQEDICGRPLGLFAGPDDKLYVADSYYGLFQYDVATGKSNQLVGPKEIIEGRKPLIFNSVTVASDGMVYWTDSSTDVPLKDGLYTLLADGTGRLIRYDPRTQRNTVLINGLLFANGVALSPDENFVVVAETGMSQLHRYWLSGSKAGTYEVFGNTLPGLPDNLRSGSKGFLVPLVMAVDDQHPLIAQVLQPFPYIRQALANTLALTELAMKKIDEIYPNKFSTRATHFLGHFEMVNVMKPVRVTIMVLDVEGQVVQTFHGFDGSVKSVSDAILYRGQIFLGSPFNNYLGRIQTPSTVARFQESFPMVPKVSIRMKTSTTTQKPPTTTAKPTSTTTTTPKPTTTTPKPTTTTPKPTTTTPKPTTETRTTTPKPTTTTTTTPKPTSKPATTKSSGRNNEL